MTATSAPIVVTGADRSGTTLLYTLLASHPRLLMVRRTNLWRWFDGKYGDLSRPDDLGRCLDAMMRYERLGVLEPNRVEIEREFGSGDRSYGRLFRILFEQHAARMGRPRWGDKSLHTELNARRVFEAWPDARMIQVVRDPRDRYASVVARSRAGNERNASVIGRWIRSTRAARRNEAEFAGRYMVVRYEDLATNPEDVTRAVCAFVGEEFDPVMMEMRGGDSRSREGGNSSFDALPPGVISTRSIGRYQSLLSGSRIACIETLCRGGMRTYGYSPGTGRLQGADLVEYWREVADGAVRVPAWLLREAFAERRGRSVPHERLASAK